MKASQLLETIKSPSQRVLELVEKARLQRLRRLFQECPTCLGKLEYQYQASGSDAVIESGQCTCCGSKIEARKFKKQ